jgi:cleavage and polyadenylation specificity factor subunit 2
MFNFTPLLGAQSSSPASQSLLEFDGGIKILIDVGWDESFDVEKLKELERYENRYQKHSPELREGKRARQTGF